MKHRLLKSELLFGLLFLAASLHSAKPAWAQDKDAEFLVPADLQQKLDAQVKGLTPAHALLSYTLVEEIDHKTNFSKVYVDSKSEFLRLDNGLIGAASNTVFRSGAAKSIGRGLTMCGLLPLVNESQAVTDNSSTAVLPMGKMFLPLGVKSSVDFNNRLRLTRFDSSAPSLCAPQLGQEFSFQYEAEHTIKTTGLFVSGTKLIQRKNNSVCKAAAEYSPANKINPNLSGEAISVVCESEDQNKKKSKEEYFYLKDFAQYLMVGRVDEWQRSVISYSAIQTQ